MALLGSVWALYNSNTEQEVGYVNQFWETPRFTKYNSGQLSKNWWDNFPKARSFKWNTWMSELPSNLGQTQSDRV